MSEQHPAAEAAVPGPDATAAPESAPQAVVPAPQSPPAAQPAQPSFQQPAPQATVAPKSPGLALLASFFFPGLGTLMNGEAGKGIGIFAGYFVSWILAFLLIGIPFLIGFWVWGMVDAYIGATKWNARHGIIS
jgi:TM2 domain-containing membrane protein YozV